MSSIFFISQISQMLMNVHGHSLQKLGDQLRSMFARGLNAAMVTVVSELVEVDWALVVGVGVAGEEEGGGGKGIDNKGWLRGNAKLPK